MEHTYRVTDRASLFIIGIVFTLVGGLFVVIGLLVALVDRDSSGSSAGRFFGGLVFAGAGSLVAYVGWDHLFRRPWRIRVWPDGEIEIQHAFQITRLQVGTITALEKVGRTLGLEDEDGRLLQIHHRGGTTPVSHFDEIDTLIADVQALSPYLTVQGSWDG